MNVYIAEEKYIEKFKFFLTASLQESATVVLKQGELLENPEKDNQQPSLNSNIHEGSETNNRVLIGNAKDSNVDTSALPEE